VRGKEEYGRDSIHINGMENFWSWAKEQMFKFHGVFRSNLFYYLKEMEWKFNHRALGVKEKAIEIAKIFSLRGWRLETTANKQGF
jgi:transposase-like protein